MITREELESNIFLPVIRRQLTLELKQLDLRQVDIAKKLRLTKAAVTQYVKNIRGNSIQLDEITIKKIKEEAKLIKENKNTLEALTDILRDMEKRKIICKHHKKIDKERKDCNLCYK